MCIYSLTEDRQSQVMKSIERHFFQNTELTTYHCVIMHILKKNIYKLKLNKQSINMQCALI